MQDSSSISLTDSVANESGKDNFLWEIAKRRAGFKISAFFYVAINCMLIGIWYFTSRPGSYFWPVWPILGWGIGIAIQYFHAYHSSDIFSVQKEYEKLKNKQ